MTLRTAFFIGTLTIGCVAAGQTPASARDQGVDTTEPIVNVGLFGVRADGTRSSSAVQTGSKVGEDLSGTLHMAPCGSLGGASPGYLVPASATDVWQLSGTVLSLGADQASVQLSVQRLRRGGQEETSAAQSTAFTLIRGQRTTLETVTVPAAGSCDARTVALDIVFASRAELYERAFHGTHGGAAAGGAARVGTEGDAAGGGGGGRGGGVVRAPTEGVDGGGGGSRVFMGRSGGLTSTRIVGPGEPAPTMPAAEMWLVRTTPGKADETLRVSAMLTSRSQPFSFTPIAIATSSGVLTVKVEGTVETGLSPEGEPRFYFSANRTVTFAPTNRPPRDAAPVVEGSTKTTVPMPGKDEVLSFEMPPLRIPGGAALPDRLSIRVKVTPVPMQEMNRRQ